MIDRAIEYDLLPTAQSLGTGVLAFGALGGGWLSGRYQDTATATGSGSPMRGHLFNMKAADPVIATKLAAVQALGDIAQKAGLSLVQLATAFVLRHPGVSSAVIGPRTMSHLDGYLAADGIHLTDEVLDQIDAVVAPGISLDATDAMWQFGTTALQAGNRRR